MINAGTQLESFFARRPRVCRGLLIAVASIGVMLGEPALAITELAADVQIQLTDGMQAFDGQIEVSQVATASAVLDTASGSASASQGVIRAIASHTWLAGGEFEPYAIAAGRYFDTLTFSSSAPNGTQGFVRVRFQATGTLAATGTAQAAWTLQFLNPAGASWGGACGSNGSPCSSPSGDPLGGVLEYVTPIIWGQPTPWQVLFGADVNRIGVGGGSATVDLSSTLRHMGIIEALDQNMNPVTGLSVSSESGVDWTVEVSDPVAVPVAGLLGGLVLSGALTALSVAAVRQRSARRIDD